jgi:hypothetical protein
MMEMKEFGGWREVFELVEEAAGCVSLRLTSGREGRSVLCGPVNH